MCYSFKCIREFSLVLALGVIKKFPGRHDDLCVARESRDPAVFFHDRFRDKGRVHTFKDCGASEISKNIIIKYKVLTHNEAPVRFRSCEIRIFFCLEPRWAQVQQVE